MSSPLPPAHDPTWETAAATAGVAASGPETAPTDQLQESLQALPIYTRSLLKVPLTVSVTLATTRIPLQRVLRLGPGSIIRFDQPCDAPLTLEVANRPVATGEAVKVGDKFGLWVTAMILPHEKFAPITRAAGERATAESSPHQPGTSQHRPS